jgi:hypothetical protein
MWKMDIGSSYNILKGSGTISAFQRYFNSMNFAGDRPYKAKRTVQLESQSVYLGFNYRFGSGKNKAIQNKGDKNETQGAVDFIELVLNFVTRKTWYATPGFDIKDILF